MMYSFSLLKLILTSRIDSGEVKNFYFLSESFLEELSNINHFTSKFILIKLILTKLILPKINYIKTEQTTHLNQHSLGTTTVSAMLHSHFSASTLSYSNVQVKDTTMSS